MYTLLPRKNPNTFFLMVTKNLLEKEKKKIWNHNRKPEDITTVVFIIIVIKAVSHLRLAL